MYSNLRAATILATEPTTCWTLNRVDFRAVVQKYETRRRDKHIEFLRKVRGSVLSPSAGTTPFAPR